MQTFLPYPDFAQSMRSLDYKRLGKQRVEAMQLLNCLPENSSSGWRNHPAAKMWRGYDSGLRMYMRAAILEWLDRGYNNTMVIPDEEDYELPSWLHKNSLVCVSHQANLVRKDAEFYAPLFPNADPEMPYYWPVS